MTRVNNLLVALYKILSAMIIVYIVQSIQFQMLLYLNVFKDVQILHKLLLLLYSQLSDIQPYWALLNYMVCVFIAVATSD